MAKVQQIIAHIEDADEVTVRGYDLSHSYSVNLGPFTLIHPSLHVLEQKLDEALHQVVLEKARLAAKHRGNDGAYDRAVGA